MSNYNNLKLNDIILHAYNTVPYYKRVFDNMLIDPNRIKSINDLKIIPTLTKEQIQKSPKSLLSNNFNKNELLYELTSGSTGTPMTIYKTIQDNIKMGFYLWLIRKFIYGISTKDRYCKFHITQRSSKSSDVGAIEISYINDNVLSLSLLHLKNNHLFEYYQKINEFKPAWIFGPPSTIFLLANFIESNRLRLVNSIKYIELTGEYLFDEYRKKIQKVFKCQVANHYGCRETYGIALECKEGNLHCLSKNVIVEILNEGQQLQYGVEGEIHITSLSNRAMPFIRYSIGDIRTLENGSNCSCGNNNPIIKVSAGRTTDYVICTDGSKIHSAIFAYLIIKLNNERGFLVFQFQIKQIKYNEFIAKINMGESTDHRQKKFVEDFIDEIKKLGLNDCIWNWIFVNNILPDKRTSKLKYFINEVL